MSVFADMIKRAASSKLSIEHYFNAANMQRFVPMLAVEDYEDMEDIVCEGSDEEEDYQEILTLVEEGMNNEHKEWENDKKEFENDESNKDKKFNKPEPKQKLSGKQKKFFKKACCKPDKWREEQKDKQEVTKSSLNETAPVMGKFFKEIHVAMKQTQLLLAYSNSNDNLSEEQKKAIAMASKMDEKEARLAVKDKEENRKDDEKEKSLTIMNRLNDGNKLIDECQALNKVAIANIHVVDSMNDDFQSSSSTLRALNLAESVENTCLEIIRNTGTIRQSLLLGYEILSLKPANFNNESRKLWDAVDSGIIQIFENALKMSKVAADYFGYFLRFRQSFSYYLSANDKSLLVSTEYLQKDIRDFNKMALKFTGQVSVLGESAMKCISSCIKNTTGAKNFEDNQAKRSEAWGKYLQAKQSCDKRLSQLNDEHSELLHEKAVIEKQVATSEMVIESLKQQKQHDINLREATQQTLNTLSNMEIE